MYPVRKHGKRIGIIGTGGYGRTARSYLNNSGEFGIVSRMDADRETVELGCRQENAAPHTDLDALLAHETVSCCPSAQKVRP